MEKVCAVVPVYEVTINGTNVTDDISVYVSQVEYSDRIEEESDEVSIILDDVEGLWQSDWYPSQGDTLTLKMGYPGNMLDCGNFEIDQIELSGLPDTLTVKAIAAAITESMRTRNSRAYEKQTLKDIAQFIADKHGLKLMGDTSRLANIEIGRKTQDNESDISFLSGIARRYGIIFSVRGDKMIFLNPEDLEKEDAIAAFNRYQISTYSFKDKTSDTYWEATVSQRDIKTNTVQKWSVQSSGDPTKQDTIVVGGRVENANQAEAVTEGAIREMNRDKLTGRFTTEGNPLLVAGANVDMEGFGAFSGKWTIRESTHRISADTGYTTEVSIRKGPYKKTFEKVTTGRNESGQVNWAKKIGLQ